MRTSSERPGKIDRVGCAPILGVSPAPHGNGAQTKHLLMISRHGGPFRLLARASMAFLPQSGGGGFRPFFFGPFGSNGFRN